MEGDWEGDGEGVCWGRMISDAWTDLCLDRRCLLGSHFS